MSTSDSPAPRRAIASRCWWCVSFGLRPINHAARFGALPALASTAADQLAFELGEAAENGQHKAPVRCRGIGSV